MPSIITFTVRPEAGISLADLPNLQPGDKLHIKGLENVTNGRDAREANLISKELSRLHMTWARNANSAEEVLGALEPHGGLEGFGLSGYEGMNIPNWMTNISILKCLVDVKLMKCRNCSKLPPLGKLPCLTTLYLSQMRDVMYIDDSPYEISTKKAFPSLKEMKLYDLPNLKRVLRIEGVEMLSNLSKLSIQSIPQFELPSLPSVVEVYVGGETEEFNDHGASFLRDIAGKMSNLTELMIENFDQIKVLPIELSSLGSLQKLNISCCHNLESIPNMSSSSLQVLSFALCHSLKSLTQSTTTLTSLRRLQIHNCPKLILPANMNMLTSLREVIIMGGNCSKLPPLGKLPCLTTLYLSEMRDVMYIDDSPYEISTEKAFPSLKEMTLYDLPNLERVLRIEGVEMLSNLSKLSIQSIPQFELRSLPSVVEVNVGGETEEFNDHGASFLRDIAGKMSNLTELMIKNFDQIKVLPTELSSLGSLQKLYISRCRNLESIPNMSLSSLQVLSYAHCDSLKSLTQSTTTLTGLQRLQIHYCPKLVLPANMNMLTSLREVSIMGGDKRRRLYNGLEGIPLLQNLTLTDLPSVRSFPNWLGNTLSLQELEISKFTMLTSLPDNFDQLENLQKLSIDRCPKLVNRLKRTGEDWYKIAHVPFLLKPVFS